MVAVGRPNIERLNKSVKYSSPKQRSIVLCTRRN
jgi:hypothetical protein